jgi:hypothetical protein
LSTATGRSGEISLPEAPPEAERTLKGFLSAVFFNRPISVTSRVDRTPARYA